MKIKFYHSVIQIIFISSFLFISSCQQNPISDTGYSTTDLNVVSFSYKDAYTSGLVRNFMSVAPTNFDDKGFPPTCTIEPALPTGLSISSPGCVISGTPVAILPPTTYTVTALSAAGMSKANLSLSVSASAPMVTYPTHTASRMNVQITINPISLYDNGSPITNCTVSPALLTGLSLDPLTCVISGSTPDYLLYRVYTVTVTNGIGSSESTFSLSVAAPPLLSFNGISGVGQVSLPFRAQPSIFNTRGEPVTSCVTTPALPQGLSINQSTCVISGTPAEVISNTYTVTATNAVGSTNSSILISITPYPPDLSYSSGMGYISVPFLATPTVLNSNGAPITSCTISPALPQGLSIDPITCVVSGIPQVSITQRNYTVTATNSTGVGMATLPMVVMPSVPVISYLGVSGAGSFGSSLSVIPSTLVNNGSWITSCTVSPALPTGLWMDNYTCSISGIPMQVIPQTTFTVSATNSAGTSTAQIPITVSPTLPELSYEGSVGKTGLAQSPRTITPRTFNYGGVSITNCTITPALPTGLSIAPTTCVISGTALYESTTTTYTVTATNVAGAGSATLDISVSPIPPTLSYSSSTGTSGLAQNAMSITPSSLNAGGTSITNCTITPALPTGLSIAPTTCVISGTALYESTTTTYTVTATSVAGTGSTTLDISVSPIPPTLSYSSSTGTSGLAQNAMSITPSSLNAGGTSITNCTISPSLPSGLSLNTTTCVISGTPPNESPLTTYTVTIHNSVGTGTATVALKVDPIPPTLSYNGSSNLIGGIYINQTINPTNFNAGGTSVVCSISPSLPSGLTLNSSNCVISGNPTVISPATNYTVNILNSAGTMSTTVSITVNPRPPSLTYASASGTVNSALTINPSSINSNGATITCTTSGLPAGLSVNSSCVISGTPTTAGSASYTITATNSAGSTNATITITIAAIAPTLSYSGASGTSGQVNSAMSISPTGLTTGGAPITNCTGTLPAGLSLNTTTCVISGTPTWGQGATTHTITITNSSNLTSTATVSITIAARLPTISFSGASTGNVGVARIITPTTYNGGANISNCTVSPALPAGLSISTSTCVISGTPSTIFGPNTYTVTIHNSAGTGTGTISISASGFMCTSNGYDGPSTAVGSLSNCWYNCSARGFDGGGTPNSLNSCFYNCSGRGLCGGNTYGSYGCYNQTWGIVGTSCWEEQSCYQDIVGYDTQCTEDCSGVSCYCGSTPYTNSSFWLNAYGTQCSPSSPIWIGYHKFCTYSGPEYGGCTYITSEYVPVGSGPNPSWCYCRRTYTGTYRECTGSCVTNCEDVPIYGNVCSTYTACQDDYGWRCN